MAKNAPNVTLTVNDLVLCNNTTIEAYFTGVPSGWTAGALSGGGAGDIVSFSGTGFGTGNVGATWRDTTDYQLANGTEIPTDDKYRENGGTFHNAFAFDTAVKIGSRAGSLKGLRKCEIKPVKTATTPAVYVTWYQRFDCALNDDNYIDTNIHAFDAQSNKFVRIWNGDDTDTDTWVSWTNRHLTYPDTPASQNSAASYSSVLPTANQWTRMELVIDGTNIKAYMDGVLKHNITDFVKQDAASDFYTQIFGYDLNYTDHIVQDFHTWLAELYRLPSQARVEVSDSATWNSGQVTRYIQNVTEWTDTSIKFELFRGDFAAQTTLYAYSIDDAGNATSLGEVL